MRIRIAVDEANLALGGSSNEVGDKANYFALHRGIGPGLTYIQSDSIGTSSSAVEISFDAAKNASNIALRGLSFERALEFDFSAAVILQDDRRAFGLLDGRLHVLVYVESADLIRVISFRRANKREVKRYGEAKAEASSGRQGQSGVDGQ